ncbi:MAG TPA: hypothetical protein VHB79_10100 [Polyangiaceae bacterium]|nr:hypothetical protein [Polyangiaceae bacterium]
MNTKFVSFVRVGILMSGLAGCGGINGADGSAVEAVGSSEQAFETASGTMRLSTYASGSWYFDTDADGAWIGPPYDATHSGFGAYQDIPLIGFGSVACGQAGGLRGVYRPSTHEYFIDNGDFNWGAGDTSISNFVVSGFASGVIHPFVYAVFVSGNSCKGVVGFTWQFDSTSPMLWVVDLNGNNVYDGSNEIIGSFGGGEDLPVPLYNPSFHSSVMTVFRPSTGQWFQDVNNNKQYDNGFDTITSFGAAYDFPFGHPNTVIRGTTRPGGVSWHRFIDMDGNGWWNNVQDKDFPFRNEIYAMVY